MSGGEGQDRPVRRRRVLYISGFDPRGAAFYHRLYREEAAKAAALGGYCIEVGRRETVEPLVQAWDIAADFDGVSVATRYEFLRWDDVIRANWGRKLPQIWAGSVGALATSLRTGVFLRSWRRSYPTAITGGLPTAFILLQILAMALAGWAAAALFSAVTGLPLVAGVLAGLVAAWGVLALAQRLEARLRIFWLGRIFAFTVKDSRSAVPGLDERRRFFAERLVAVAREASDDEILLVGHSLGSPLAISAAARAAEIDPALGRRGPRVSVLILGSTTPMLASLPGADWFRRDLRLLAEAEGVDWIEFTSPPDGACYALVDPLAFAVPDYRAPARLGARPKLLNARFIDLMDPSTYRRVRRDWMRLHFQYLMAGDRLGEYDYFDITAGPLTLAGRFADREPVRDYEGLRPFRR